MTVYKEGYYCHVCNKTVKAKIWWSNEENDLIASCTLCGTDLQRVIPTPASKLQWPKGYIETFSTPLAGGGTRPGQPACIPNSGEAFSPREPSQAAPAPPQEDTR